MAQKPSRKDGKKRSKGPRATAAQGDHKKLLLIGIAIVYTVAFAIGCVPFFMKHYTSRHVHLSDVNRRQQPNIHNLQSHFQVIGNPENTVTVTIKEPDGRVTQGIAPVVPASALPKETLEAWQQHIPPRRRPATESDPKKSLIDVGLGNIEGVPFYRCINNKQHTIRTGDRDLVILGAGAFFNASQLSSYRGKEGVQTITAQERASAMQNGGTFLELCHAGFKDGLTSVIALDATLLAPTQLLRLLQTLEISLPVAAIVTPRQSSATMVEWLLYQGDPTGDNAPEQHKAHVMLARHWIPVSPQWDEDKSHELLMDSNSSHNDVNNYPAVFSLYGAESTNANSAEQIVLRQTMTATSQAIPGGDDCYLENYREFAWAIYDYLLRHDELPGRAAVEASQQQQQQQLLTKHHFHIETSTDMFSVSSQ